VSLAILGPAWLWLRDALRPPTMAEIEARAAAPERLRIREGEKEPGDPDTLSAMSRAALAAEVEQLASMPPAEGRLGRRVGLDGCEVVVTIAHPADFCDSAERGTLTWREARTDLRILRTDFGGWSVLPAREGREEQALVRLPVDPAVQVRLIPMEARWSDEVQRQIAADNARGVYDMVDRVARFRAFADAELTDPALHYKRETMLYCGAEPLTTPAMFPQDLRLYVDVDAGQRLLDLLHAHATRECPFDPGLLD
jgi:hypothetical protein